MMLTKEAAATNVSGRGRGRLDDLSPASPVELGRSGVVRMVAGSKIFGEGESSVAALDDVTVGFAAGRFSAVMGPSGSGKSTLLYCLSGLDRLSSGAAFLGDNDVAKMTDAELAVLRRTDMGFVFQSFHLVPALTARENITLPIDLAKAPVEEEYLAELAGVLEISDRLENRPSQLSGGQRQRVAVARAMISRPKVIFADEPTGALDSKTASDLLSYLRSAVDELGQTIVMVTHDPVAAAVTDRAVFLRDGRIEGFQDEPTVDQILDVIKERI